MKTVYFVRHGETEANVARVLAGSRSDTPLTEAGIEQAHQVATKLKDLHVQLIVASPLSRARETARVIAQDIDYHENLTLNDLFVERDYGSATELPYPEAHEVLHNDSAVEVESIPELANRARQALDWLNQQQPTVILVVSHGAFGQMFGTVAEDGDPELFRDYRHLDNAEFYTMEIGKDS